MTTKIKFPYTMHCPKCKVGLKIKSKEMIGKRINCPKCKARIDVVTPDEDAVVPYIVEPPPEKEVPPEPTEEEILQRQLEIKRKKRIETLKQAGFWLSIVILVAMIVGVVYVVYNYALVPFMNEDLSLPEENDIGVPKEFK